jgi:hypothetical protein
VTAAGSHGVCGFSPGVLLTAAGVAIEWSESACHGERIRCKRVVGPADAMPVSMDGGELVVGEDAFYLPAGKKLLIAADLVRYLQDKKLDGKPSAGCEVRPPLFCLFALPY